MSNEKRNFEEKNKTTDEIHEGRDKYFMDIDRMINEGLGGGQVTMDNGLIDSEPEIEEENK